MTTYSYDDLHRLTGRSYARGQNSPSYPTTQGADAFTYDRAGRMLTLNARRRTSLASRRLQRD